MKRLLVEIMGLALNRRWKRSEFRRLLSLVCIYYTQRNLPNSWNSHKTSKLPFTQYRSEVSWWWSTLDQLSFACFPQNAYSGIEISCICEGWWGNGWPTNILNKSLYYTTRQIFVQYPLPCLLSLICSWAAFVLSLYCFCCISYKADMLLLTQHQIWLIAAALCRVPLKISHYFFRNSFHFHFSIPF